MGEVLLPDSDFRAKCWTYLNSEFLREVQRVILLEYIRHTVKQAWRTSIFQYHTSNKSRKGEG
jgi:hypothetical protein